MKNLNKFQTVFLLFLSLSTLNACAKSTEDKSKVKSSQQSKKTTVAPLQGTANVQAELNKSKKASEAVFVVVTATGITDAGKALTLANKAKASYKNAAVLVLDRDETANASLVSEWGLSTAPLPLVLVVSPKGTAVGGLELKEASADKLINIIPTPKEDELYTALNKQKPVFVVVGKKTNADRVGLMGNCKIANTQLRGTAVIVELDPNDPKEQKFVKMMNIKTAANSSSVLVFNASGQSTGSFPANVGAAALVTAANKVIRSSCCPGGGGSCK